MKPEDLFDIKDDCPPELHEKIEEYLEPFEAPGTVEGEGNFLTGSLLCDCGSALDGYLGSFTYDIFHGEGHCTQCGRPIRANHYIKDDDGKDLVSFNLLLLYRKLEEGEEGKN